jgi:hypothetical protein
MREKHLLASVIFAILSAPLTGQAHAQSDNEALDARAVGMGETLRAAASGALSTTLNPAGVALVKNYVIEGSYMYRPSDHSNVEAISLCDSVTTRIAACLYYNHISASPDDDPTGDGRTLHEGGITMAMPLGESFSLGITQKYVDYTDPVSENSHSGFGMDAGLIFKLMPTLNVAGVVYNIYGNDQARFARALGGGVAFNAGKLLLAADMRWNTETSAGRYGAGAEYMFGGDNSQGIPVRAGYVYDDLLGAQYVTAGLGYVSQRVAVDVGMRKEVSTGDEFMVQFSLRVFMPN